MKRIAYTDIYTATVLVSMACRKHETIRNLRTITELTNGIDVVNEINYTYLNVNITNTSGHNYARLGYLPSALITHTEHAHKLKCKSQTDSVHVSHKRK